MGDLLVSQLGLVPYAEALALQERLREARIDGTIDQDILLLLEHPPVITRGRRSTPEEMLLGEDFLRAQGFDVVTTQRGGLATYHGPGMLVGYPIVRTGDVVAYLRALERAIISALAEQGVSARQRESTPTENLTGVWTGPGGTRKIASLGVHMSRGVAIHGFAIGADNDLEPWSWFTACGLPSVQMTSIAAETGHPDTLEPLRASIGAHVAHELGLTAREVDPSVLRAAAGEQPA